MRVKIPYSTALLLLPLALACGRQAPPPETDIQQEAVTTTETDRIIPADVVLGDNFGRAMAMDGTTLAAGSYSSDEGGSNSGKVHVFGWDGNAWVEHDQLLPATMGISDHFGSHITIDGDRMAISAQGKDGEIYGAAEGSVYIFERTGTTWNEVAYLESPTPTKGGLFGVSVALEGDIMLASATGEGLGGTVYVYRRDPISGQWEADGTIDQPDARYKDGFGFPVSLDSSGDLAAISAPNRDIGEADDAGTVYVFRHDGADWTLDAEIVPDDPVLGLRFGSDAMEIEGNTLVIGSYGYGGTFSSQGAAFVYTHDGTSWTLEDTLVASNAGQNCLFGRSLDLEGNRLLVGSERGHGNATHSGSAYIFERSGGTWTETNKLIANDGTYHEYFGMFVALAGDMVAASSPWDHEAGDYSGSVFTFDLNPPPPPPPPPSDCPDPSEVGDGSFCSPECPCDHGEGDCDDDEDCADGLFCLRDVGPAFGFPDPDLDVCSEICPTTGNGGGNYCSEECPCEHGEGDCDGDEDCVSGTYCKRDSGLEFGFSDPELDVCSNS